MWGQPPSAVHRAKRGVSVACGVVTNMLPLINVREYVDPEGRSSYSQWFEDLNAPAAAKTATAIIRMSHGNFSNVKGVGAGVFEYKLDLGPGYGSTLARIVNV